MRGWYLAPLAIVEHDADGDLQLANVVAVAAVMLCAEHSVPQEDREGAAFSLHENSRVSQDHPSLRGPPDMMSTSEGSHFL